MINQPLILASRSSIRATMLSNAGYQVIVDPSDIDEEPFHKRAQVGELTAYQLAEGLAQAKARDVSIRRPDDIVIGADQVLDHQGHCGKKSKSMDDARQVLASLSGNTHRLISAAAVVQNDIVIATVSDHASLTMRSLDHGQIDRYLKKAGEDILYAVGCYQIENLGIQLFDTIDGDTFTIQGLPLIKLKQSLEIFGYSVI